MSQSFNNAAIFHGYRAGDNLQDVLSGLSSSQGVFLRDGSFRYNDNIPEENLPEELPSYERNPDDPYLFHPKWIGCRHQKFVSSVEAGAVRVSGYCGNINAYPGEEVTPNQCAGCKHRFPD